MAAPTLAIGQHRKGRRYDAEVMQELWPQPLQAVKNRRRFTWILLSQNAKVHAYDGTTLTVTWNTQGALRHFTGSDSRGVLDEALQGIFHLVPAVEAETTSHRPER